MSLAALFPPDQSPYHWEMVPMKDISAAFLGVTCAIEALVLTVVGLRFYSRITTALLGWDDWWVLVATILCIVDVLGSGYFVAEVAINLSTIYLLIFILQPLFLFTIMATKVSVCCFYLRVFVGKTIRIATYITLGLVVLWAVAHYLAAVFICTPVAGQYDLRLSAVTKCGDQSKFFQSGLSINAVLDAVVLALPLWTIWKLNMRTSDKIGLLVAFSIGFAILAVSIIRAVYVTTTSLTGDVTNTLPTNLFLTVFEQQLAIITISIPMLRPLWNRYRNRATAYNIEDGRSHEVGKSPLATFGGTGEKSNRKGRQDESVLDTVLELRDVSHETTVKGPETDRLSVTSDWDSRDTGSETRLDASHDNGGVIKIKNEWKVSKA